MPLYRTIDLVCTIKRRWPFAKWNHRTAAVEHYTGFQIFAGRGHEIDQPAAHAKADDAQPTAVDLPVILEESDGGMDIVDNRRVTQAGFARRTIVFTVRTIAVVEIRRQRSISLKRQHVGGVFDEIFQARLAVYHDDTRHRPAARRHT